MPTVPTRVAAVAGTRGVPSGTPHASDNVIYRWRKVTDVLDSQALGWATGGPGPSRTSFAYGR